MARRMRYGLALLLLLIALSIVSCGQRNDNPYQNPEYAKYFTGKEGVEARFENVPTTLYYYGPDDNAGNEFTFSVEVRNQGASFSRGGIYVSGFDPHLLVFREIPIGSGRLGGCGISIGSLGLGEFGGILRCDGIEVSGNERVQNIRIDSLAELVRGIGQLHGKSWWQTDKFDFSVNAQNGPAGQQFVVNLNRANLYVDYYQHGRLFIAYLAGIDYRLNGGQEFLLAGDTYEFPGGETSYYTYNGKIVDWPVGLDQTVQSLLLTTCYQYTTYADPIVCIDPEPHSENRKVCRPQSRTWGGGNGAPVAITSVEQENTPRKIIFRINVKNIGGGTVYDPGKLQKCSPYYPGKVTAEDLNLVWIGDVRIGQVGLRNSGGMSCYPEVIRLDPRTGTGTTTCTYPLDLEATSRSAYQTPLVVELWYGYSKAEQRNVRIKRVI